MPSINPLIQTYAYDSLNRIKSATETQSSSQTWKQTFTYDRYGNRNFDAANTTTLGSCSTAQCNPTVDSSNNRFTTGQGYTYDLSGNLVQDAQNRTFYFDGENKQKEVRDASNNSIGQYLYDGDAKRVKKLSSADTTVFIYDASGKLAAEYLLTSAPTTAPTTSYLTSDTLGSPRVITDSSGNIQSRRDFMPFGEEISGFGNRTSTIGYQANSTRQKFTSHERDEETIQDYAKARYLNFNFGKFLTPDPFGPWAMTEDEKEGFYNEPQKWNLYAYVTNNPLKFSDPTGLERYDSNTVNSADEKKIRDAFDAILKYGTKKQKEIVRAIQKSDLLIQIGNVGGSAVTGVANAGSTQQKIDTTRLNEVQALGELQITINPGTLATQKGIQGTLVHETRHALHQARAISEFSQADLLARAPYNPDGYAIEYAAHKSYADYVVQSNRMNNPVKQDLINEATGLGLINKKGNGIGVSEAGIRARLALPTASGGYDLNDTTKRGSTFSTNWNLTPRNSW